MRFLEVMMWTLGTMLIIGFLSLRADGESERLDGIEQLTLSRESLRAPQPPRAQNSMPEPVVAADPAPAPAITEKPVLAVLRIARLSLEVPVKYGTSEAVLRGGAGLIEGTAPPDAAGNVGIAAHRDTFFRPLEDVARGDLIEVETTTGFRSFRVITLSIVRPDQVSVLENTGANRLTLVTCYPFRYFGNAPLRFIVGAEEEPFEPTRI